MEPVCSLTTILMDWTFLLPKQHDVSFACCEILRMDDLIRLDLEGCDKVFIHEALTGFLG